MWQKKIVTKVIAYFILFFCISLIPFRASAATGLLKQGMEGSAVASLQQNLKKLGYFSLAPTGYYGEITTLAVKKLQGKFGLCQDGIAGSATFSLINKLLNKETASITASRGGIERNYYLVPWYGGVEEIFAIGVKAEVFDIGSGLSFNIIRSFGYNHADCEPQTAEDTRIMKRIYGGEWSWDRRSIIVTVRGRRIAASMAGMPHAGRDDMPAEITVKARSGGYGTGANLDRVKDNKMDGHFDIHFLGSRTHSTNEIEPNHQAALKKAAEWAEKHW